MIDETERHDFSWHPELEGFLVNFKIGQEQGDQFGLIDMLAMAALELHQAGQAISVQSVMDYAEQQVWPTVEREPMYQGEDNTFDSYRSIIRLRVREVLAALQDPEPAEALLRVERSNMPDA